MLIKDPPFSYLAGTVRQNELELCREALYRLRTTKYSPFRYFKTSPEIIRLAVILYVRFPLSLRNVEDLLHERGIGVGLTQAATVAIYNERILLSL